MVTKQKIAAQFVAAYTDAGTIENLTRLFEQHKEQLHLLKTREDANHEDVMTKAVNVQYAVHCFGFAIAILQGKKLKGGDFWTDLFIENAKEIDPKNEAGVY